MRPGLSGPLRFGLVRSRAVRRLALIGVPLAVLAFSGCGGGSSTDSAGVTITPTSEVVAESEGSYDNAPPITKELVREWPERWCTIPIGASREEVVKAMGAYPTDQDSHKIPHIPLIHLNSRGEDVNPKPPMPAGSDTWEAPGSFQFNAFFDSSLRLQQLDFGGPAAELPCAATRVR